MRALILGLCAILLIAACQAWSQNIDGQAGGGASLTVKENDNIPNVSGVSSISFTNGTVTDDGGGAVSVTISVTGSPSFTNAATGDFTLQSGSSCRDVGLDLSATLTTDYIGTSRPQNGTFDIGAYEYLISVGGGGSTGNLGKSSKGLMGGL